MGSALIAGVWTIPDGCYEGQIIPNQPIPDVYRRVGQVGSSIQQMGNQGPPSTILVHYPCSALATAVSVRNSFTNLQAASINVTEPSGVSYNVIVLQAAAQVRGGRYTIGGASYPFRVSARFIFEAQP